MCKLPSSWPPAWGTQGRFRTGCCVSGGSGGSGAELREAQKPFIFKLFLALLAGIEDLFLALTLKKPKKFPGWSGRISGQMSGRMSGWMSGRISGRMSGQISGPHYNMRINIIISIISSIIICIIISIIIMMNVEIVIINISLTIMAPPLWVI